LITDNRYILDIVENGYKIPFKTQPEQMYINNKKSWLKNKDFVASEITNLLNKGCIREVSTKPLIVNPLTVAFSKSSKPRLVLDCRHINPHHRPILALEALLLLYILDAIFCPLLMLYSY
jgi:hypothetical protein